MSISKQQLRDRLQLRFEPLHHRHSLKKLQAKSIIQSQKELTLNTSLSKSRSITQIKLPSLEAIKNLSKEEQASISDLKFKIKTLKNTRQQNIIDLKNQSTTRVEQQILKKEQQALKAEQKILRSEKSVKYFQNNSKVQQPIVKAESKQPIHLTLTYLLKKEILSLPKIVELLRNSQSQEFLYMRVKGIYQYQACQQKDKGLNYVTISRNGMVVNGELIPLQQLAHEYELYNLIKKVNFFRYFTKCKYMAKWRKISKKALFLQRRHFLTEHLNLNIPLIIKWKKNLFCTVITTKYGSFGDNWISHLCQELQIIRSKLQQRLNQLCLNLLVEFGLPISEFNELMSDVLCNLQFLNRPFEVKIRIQRQLQIFYKVGRQAELYLTQKIGQFVISHLKVMISKIDLATSTYNTLILSELQQLNIQAQNYSEQRDRIMLNLPEGSELDFSFQIENNTIVLKPSIDELEETLIQRIDYLIAMLQRISFKLVRTKRFEFLKKSLGVSSYGEEEEHPIMGLIYSIPIYPVLLESLNHVLSKLKSIAKSRENLLSSFHEVYKSYKTKCLRPLGIEPIYEDCVNIFKGIEESLLHCQKLRESEPFPCGYLSLSRLCTAVKGQVLLYRSNVILQIPLVLQKAVKSLQQKIIHHASVLSNPVLTPQSFIQISNQIQFLQQQLPEYSGLLLQIQRIEQLYAQKTQIPLDLAKPQNQILKKLRHKIKSFKQVRDDNFTNYRRELEHKKTQVTQTIGALEGKDPQLYSISNQPGAICCKLSEIIASLKTREQQLKDLNMAATYFMLKETYVPKLEVLLIQYESLYEIWGIYNYYSCLVSSHLGFSGSHPIDKLRQLEQSMRKLERYARNIEYYELCQYLLPLVKKCLEAMKLVDVLQTPFLRPKDILQIKTLLNEKILKSKHFRTSMEENQNCQIQIEQLTLSLLIQHGLSDLLQEVQEICLKSQKEQEIQAMLIDYSLWWKELRLEGEALEEYPLVFIFRGYQNIKIQLQDHNLLLISILNHKYSQFVSYEVQRHLRQLQNLRRLLEMAMLHQEKFLGLFPILTSKYFEKQLPQEYKKFGLILNKTMKNFKGLCKPTECLGQQTRQMLEYHTKQFETMQRVLRQFLEKKRVHFQRFYFLQDQEMLEILVGIASQNDIFSMFDGIQGWMIKDGIKCGVEGVGHQLLYLKGWTHKQQEPQLVFKGLEDSISSNLNSIVRSTLYQFQVEMRDLKDLYSNIPWMCVYTVELILFTKQVEINCFHNGVPMQAQGNLILQNIASVQPKENSNYITLQLFLLNFVRQLQHHNVQDIYNFRWNSFLRYYFEKEGVMMRALGSQHNWGGQYQGFWNLMINTSEVRRVHTCVLSSLKMGNGVLLQGPSGAGKTQSLKELARYMAKCCLLLNCSREVSVATLNNILSGLCYTGSWICLDEINRLSAETMSVIANQIHVIRAAVLQRKNYFSFMGSEVKLKQGIGIFSTMNPIYLKRAHLTENLKAYFRTLSFTTPSFQEILEVFLYSLGFKRPSDSAKQISELFKNLRIQLSVNPQYDFGLRAMRALVHYIAQSKNSGKSDNEAIFEGLYEVFYGRLHPDDCSTFKSLVAEAFNQNKFARKKLQIMKNCPQTGIIVLGPTSSKSTLIQDYCNLYDKQAIQQKLYNPLSTNLTYLIGQTAMGKWQPGIVQQSVRDSLNQPGKLNVLILDSRLKSESIQNYNSLLDNSRTLTLSNGTRLKVGKNFKLIMETDSLKLTSPATITRCGIIYIDQRDIDCTQFVAEKFPLFQGHQSILASISKYLCFYRINEWIRIISIVHLLLPDYSMAQDYQDIQQGVERLVVYSIMLLGWSIPIRHLLTRANSLPLRKCIYRHYLCFNRFPAGEFLEFSINLKPKLDYLGIYIPTPRDSFCNYMHKKALSGQKSVLWRSSPMQGRTTTIKNDLILLMEKQQSTLCKLPVHKFSGFSHLVKVFEDKFLGKKQQKNIKLIYIDNTHLANEQTLEFLRFYAEHLKIYSPKIREIVKLPRHTAIANFSQRFPACEFRFIRHFIDLPLPEIDQFMFYPFYQSLLRTTISTGKTPNTFKTMLQFDLEKISFFLWSYRQKLSAQKPVGSMRFAAFMKYFKFLDQKNITSMNDFMLFMLRMLRTQETRNCRHEQQRIDRLKTAFNEVFKQKYQEQATKIFKFYTQRPSQSVYFSGYNSDNVRVLDWKNFFQQVQRNYADHYISEFVLLEVLHALNSLQFNVSNYYLIGPPSIGKTTIIKIACSMLDRKVNYAPTESAKIAQWYCELLSQCYHEHKIQNIILSPSNKSIQQLLIFLQNIKAQYPIQSLLPIQQTDRIVNSVNNYYGLQYNRSQKTYEMIVEDYFAIMSKMIHLVFMSSNEKMLDNHYYLCKSTTVRVVRQLPLQSIMQVSEKIIDNRLEKPENCKTIVSMLLKNYNSLKTLAATNNSQGKGHFHYNPIIHFKFIENYCQTIKKWQQRHKQQDAKYQLCLNRVQLLIQSLKTADQSFIFFSGKVQQTQVSIEAIASQIKQLHTQRQQLERNITDIQFELNETTNRISQAQESQKQSNIAFANAYKETTSVLSSFKSEFVDLNFTDMQPLLVFTLENIMIMLNEPFHLSNMKRVFADPSLLIRLKNIKPTEDNLRIVQERIKTKPEWNYKSLSLMCFSMRNVVPWTIHAITLHTNQNQIKALQQILSNLLTNQHILQKKLSQFMPQLDDVVAKQKKARQNYEYQGHHLLLLRSKLQTAQSKSNKINIIINYLQELQAKWLASLQISKQQIKYTQINCLMTNYILHIYCGLGDQERIKINTQILHNVEKCHFIIDSSFNPLGYIRENIMHQKQLDQSFDNKQSFELTKAFYLDSLSYDQLTSEKHVQLLYHIKSHPVILDPDRQAIKWLQNHFKNQSQVIITKESFHGYENHIERAVKQGYLLLILIQEDIQCSSLSLLNSKITTTNQGKFIHYSNNIYHIHPRFQLVFCSRSNCPKISVTAAVNYPIINFSVGQQQLKNALFERFLQRQSASNYYSIIYYQQNLRVQTLETRSDEQCIINAIINNTRQEQFIDLLVNIQIATVNKRTYSQTLLSQFQSLKENENKYEPLCKEAADIYMSFKIMQNVNSLLCCNLQLFLEYFDKACQLSISTPLEQQINNDQTDQIGLNYEFKFQTKFWHSRPSSSHSLKSNFTKHLEDPLDFTEKQEPDRQNFIRLASQPWQVNQSMKGTITHSRIKAIKQHLLNKVTSSLNYQERRIWALILSLSDQEPQKIALIMKKSCQKQGLKSLLQTNIIPFLKNFFMSMNQDPETLANTILTDQNPFKTYSKLLKGTDIILLSVICRPQLFSTLILLFIKEKGFENLLSNHSYGPQDWFRQSSNPHPTLLLMGQDPLQRIGEYLSRKKYKKAVLIPIGQRQQRSTKYTIQKESQRGGIVILYNLHVSQQILSSLINLLQQFYIKQPHPNFRLFLVSNVQFFPAQLMSACHKFLINQPEGFRNRIKNLNLATCSQLCSSNYWKLKFSLSLFHAMVCELLNYHNLGWTNKYEFTFADYLASNTILQEVLKGNNDINRYTCNIQQNFSKNQSFIDFEAIKYLIGNVIYIGKLSNKQDRQRMKLYIQRHFGDHILKQGYHFSQLPQYPILHSVDQLDFIVNGIPQEDPKIFGLNEHVRPTINTIAHILQMLKKSYKKILFQPAHISLPQIKPLKCINHPLDHINIEIEEFNIQLKASMDSRNQSSLRYLTQKYKMLNCIHKDTKNLSLGAFNHCQKLLNSIKKEFLKTLNYKYTYLCWSTSIREGEHNYYRIDNLTLQGGSIANNRLEDGINQQNVMLYVQVLPRKRQPKETVKLVSIPMYYNENRQGEIDSHGENTNLITMIQLESAYPQQFWVLRGTSFIIRRNS